MNKSDLEIVLITYNRLPFLKRTMEYIFDTHSPVKDFPITVLDNCCTDGTNNYLQELSRQHKNLKVIKNNFNIGGNLNIARAFEIATHTYLWILCDDDTYDWTHWPELEETLAKKPDLVIVNTEYTKGDVSFPKMMRLLTFVPASIYRREAILPAAIKNIYFNAENWFPHLAAVCEVVNKNGKICTLQNNLIITGRDQDHDRTFNNHADKTLAIKSRLIFFEVGYLASLSLINDPKKRAEAVEDWNNNHHSFFYNMMSLCKVNIIQNRNSLQNYISVFNVCNFWQKIRFCFAIIIVYLRFYLLYPKYNKRRKQHLMKVERTNEVS